MKLPSRHALWCLLLLLVPAACGSPEPSDAKSDNDKLPNVKLDYKGPGVRASIEDSGQLAVLKVLVDVNSGGYELKLDETKPKAPGCEVLLTLTSPAEGEAVSAALETKKVDVPLPNTDRPVYVRISQVIRGVEYIQQPPYELAAVVR